MPDEALVGLLVVGGDMIGFHPSPKCVPQMGGGEGLEKTVGAVDHIMAPGAEKAHPGAVRHGELNLVPVAVRLGCAVDDGNFARPAADALQGILDLLALEAQLFLIGHVPQLTAAALGVLRTVRCLTAGGRLQHLGYPPPGGAFADLEQLDLAKLTCQRALDKDGLPVQPGHPLPGAAVALDAQGVTFVLLRCHGCFSFSSRLVWGGRCTRFRLVQRPLCRWDIKDGSRSENDRENTSCPPPGSKALWTVFPHRASDRRSDRRLRRARCRPP